MMRTLAAALLGLSLLPSTALAGPHVRASVHVAVPGVSVVLNPWGPGYVPAARPGWVWVGGHYDRWGYWNPGHWVPAASRAGYVWVNGYWTGGTYVDGYWRPSARPGYAWHDGYYSHGRWVSGGWAAHQYRAAQHERWEDIREAREDRHERWEDRNEYREDQAERREDRAERREDQAERYEDHAERNEDRGEAREDRGERGESGEHRSADSSRSRHHDYE